jgi:uncharacterized protein (UPF0147 family)
VLTAINDLELAMQDALSAYCAVLLDQARATKDAVINNPNSTSDEIADALLNYISVRDAIDQFAESASESIEDSARQARIEASAAQQLCYDACNDPNVVINQSIYLILLLNYYLNS